MKENKLLFATWKQAAKAWHVFNSQKGKRIIPYEKILERIINNG